MYIMILENIDVCYRYVLLLLLLLLSTYRESVYSKIRVAYNNVVRKRPTLPP